jgi:1-phosphofructokinase family hexose kinase
MTTTILCVTPNVAIDRTLMVPDFQPGRVQRTREVLVQTGSKGVNVARALRTLGGSPLAMGLLGGHTGRHAAELVAHEGLPAVWTWYEGETRTCTIIVPSDGDVTVINENGRVGPDDWRHLAADVCAHLDGIAAVCISGSLPLGVPDDAPGDLVTAICAAGVPVWVDASGAALRHAVAAGATGIKVNGAEVGQLLGRTVDDPPGAAAAAQALRERGIQTAVVTLGARGAVLADASGAWFLPAPTIEAVSDVGSGDSFLAGLVLALMSGQGPQGALRYGTAAGAANALEPGAAQFSRESFTRLLAALDRQPVERL